MVIDELGMATITDYMCRQEKTIQVSQRGRICTDGRKISLSMVFAGQLVGIREVEDKVWPVSFMDYELGYFDEEVARIEPANNPFIPKVLPMYPVWTLKKMVAPP